ncbi:NAD-dependent epimerase/dehydratase family protein [Marinobacter profundi]|uniref:NAD-dependent dehydratase n=1 Tax=Marinobacter profundi TaxID=2666256 RepID=A0A2G1UKY4_9GAMM|nr:NAD-dependent epimerase/dehydratase family protein [Marinobacter profundi]PHQ15105.1 NAD-dependent dehydratase [Marinobacter profundi]
MTILVTGATGFIGRHLCTTLTRDGHRVIALLRSPGALDPLRRFVNSNGGDGTLITPLAGDLERSDLGLEKPSENITAVVHLAARFGWGLAAAAAQDTNVTGSLRVAALAGKLGCRLVFVSGFMLANQPHLERLGISAACTDWTKVYRRVGAYEASKLEGAWAVRQFTSNNGLEMIEVQPATVIGHRQSGDLDPAQPFFSLLDNLYHGRMAMVPGSPAHWLPLVTVDYLSEVISAACLQPQVPARLLALDPATPGLRDLLAILAAELGCKAPQRHLPVGLMQFLLRLPMLARALRVAPESLEFIGTTRFDTAATDAFMVPGGIRQPELTSALRASARHYLSQQSPRDRLPSGSEQRGT